MQIRAGLEAINEVVALAGARRKNQSNLLSKGKRPSEESVAGNLRGMDSVYQLFMLILNLECSTYLSFRTIGRRRSHANARHMGKMIVSLS